MTTAELKQYVIDRIPTEVYLGISAENLLASFIQIIDELGGNKFTTFDLAYNSLTLYNSNGPNQFAEFENRFWKAKNGGVDFSNQSPPTDPDEIGNLYWDEVSKSDSSKDVTYSPGVYGDALNIVYHVHSTEGPNLFVLTEELRPFESSAIETEYAAGKWYNLTKKDSDSVEIVNVGGTDSEGAPLDAYNLYIGKNSAKKMQLLKIIAGTGISISYEPLNGGLKIESTALGGASTETSTFENVAWAATTTITIPAGITQHKAIISIPNATATANSTIAMSGLTNGKFCNLSIYNNDSISHTITLTGWKGEDLTTPISLAAGKMVDLSVKNDGVQTIWQFSKGTTI